MRKWATFSTTLKELQCSKTIMSYDRSQCFLALCVCALGRGLTEKVLGLSQRRGGGVPRPFEGGWGPPPPPYSPPNCRTPLGVTHWLAAAPVGWVYPPSQGQGHPMTAPPWFPIEVGVVMSLLFPTHLDSSAFCGVLVAVELQPVCTPWLCRNLYLTSNLAHSGPWHIMNWPF